MSVIRVTLLGDAAVGKTTYLFRLLGGEFIVGHVPTTEDETYTLPFGSRRGPVSFWITDTSSVGEARGDAAIICYDASRPSTLAGALRRRDEVLRRADVPVAMVELKSDLKTFEGRSGKGLFRVSSRYCASIEPLEYIARQALDDPDLVLQT